MRQAKKTRPRKAANPWERRNGESARAYVAFCAYRDLGPSRSLSAAYGQHKGIEKAAVTVPGAWTRWSVKFRWVERAEAWDADVEKKQQAAFDARLKQLAHDQADFAVEEFRRLVQRVRKADKILDKADSHPITDVVQEQDAVGMNGELVKKRTKIRGVNFAGYAALMKEIRESARRAILGPRDDAEEENDRQKEVKGIVWKEPAATGAK